MLDELRGYLGKEEIVPWHIFIPILNLITLIKVRRLGHGSQAASGLPQPAVVGRDALLPLVAVLPAQGSERSLEPGGSPSARLTSLARLGTGGRFLVVLALAGVAGIVAFTPVKVCVFAWLFHVPCPGCGLTRAATALLRGDVAAATRMHPLAVVVVPAWAISGRRMRTTFLARGEFVRMDRWRGRWITATCTVLVVLLFGVWIARFCGYFGGPVAI